MPLTAHCRASTGSRSSDSNYSIFDESSESSNFSVHYLISLLESTLFNGEDYAECLLASRLCSRHQADLTPGSRRSNNLLQGALTCLLPSRGTTIGKSEQRAGWPRTNSVLCFPLVVIVQLRQEGEMLQRSPVSGIPHLFR